MAVAACIHQKRRSGRRPLPSERLFVRRAKSFTQQKDEIVRLLVGRRTNPSRTMKTYGDSETVTTLVTETAYRVPCTVVSLVDLSQTSQTRARNLGTELVGLQLQIKARLRSQYAVPTYEEGMYALIVQVEDQAESTIPLDYLIQNGIYNHRPINRRTPPSTQCQRP